MGARNVFKEIGASVGNLLGGAARIFGWEGTAAQSLQTICRWIGISEDDRIWKFGSETDIANAIIQKLKNNKNLSATTIAKIQAKMDTLPPALSQNMARAVNEQAKKYQDDYKKAVNLQSTAEQFENAAMASGAAQTQKLLGTRIHDHENTAFKQADQANEAYKQLYELGKDY